VRTPGGGGTAARRRTTPPSVEDADATAGRADELGGAAILGAPFDVLDAGHLAAIRDPTGTIVSLWQPRSQVRATLVNDIGALCWNELATSNVERAKAFFGELLGWQYQTAASGYTTIKNAGRLNGGMREQTEQERGLAPSWLPYFTVKSAGDAARRLPPLPRGASRPRSRSPSG
jgi:predicted enzyme related to lactoylglutathione lyase